MNSHKEPQSVGDWLMKYWPVLLVAGSMLIAFVHLEDVQQSMKQRMDFHFGQEW